MTTDQRIDPYRGFNFMVEIDGTQVGGFSEVSGLNAQRDPVEYREGADVENHVRKLTGLSKYANITLKRGYVKDDTLWRWYAKLAAGKDDRRNIVVTLHDEMHNPVMSWSCEGAWITSLMAPTFNATGNEVIIESLECVFEKLTLDLEG